MKITKKIIALAMAGVMALSVVPVASPAPMAKAAAGDLAPNTTSKKDYIALDPSSKSIASVLNENDNTYYGAALGATLASGKLWVNPGSTAILKVGIVDPEADLTPSVIAAPDGWTVTATKAVNGETSVIVTVKAPSTATSTDINAGPNLIVKIKNGYLRMVATNSNFSQTIGGKDSIELSSNETSLTMGTIVGSDKANLTGFTAGKVKADTTLATGITVKHGSDELTMTDEQTYNDSDTVAVKATAAGTSGNLTFSVAKGTVDFAEDATNKTMDGKVQKIDILATSKTVKVNLLSSVSANSASIKIGTATAQTVPFQVLTSTVKDITAQAVDAQGNALSTAPAGVTIDNDNQVVKFAKDYASTVNIKFVPKDSTKQGTGATVTVEGVATSDSSKDITMIAGGAVSAPSNDSKAVVFTKASAENTAANMKNDKAAFYFKDEDINKVISTSYYSDGVTASTAAHNGDGTTNDVDGIKFTIGNGVPAGSYPGWITYIDKNIENTATDADSLLLFQEVTVVVTGSAKDLPSQIGISKINDTSYWSYSEYKDAEMLSKCVDTGDTAWVSTAPTGAALTNFDGTTSTVSQNTGSWNTAPTAMTGVKVNGTEYTFAQAVAAKTKFAKIEYQAATLLSGVDSTITLTSPIKEAGVVKDIALGSIYVEDAGTGARVSDGFSIDGMTIKASSSALVAGKTYNVYVTTKGTGISESDTMTKTGIHLEFTVQQGYIFNYNYDGASVKSGKTITPVSISSDDTTTVKLEDGSNLEYTGATFLGWAYASDATKADITAADAKSGLSKAQIKTSIDKQINGTIELYAVWDYTTYTLSYDANGGAGTASGKNFTVAATDVILPTTGFTNGNKPLIGWATTSTGKTATGGTLPVYSGTLNGAQLQAIVAEVDPTAKTTAIKLYAQYGAALKSVSINPATLALTVGSATGLVTATALDEDNKEATSAVITFTSDNPGVAQVDEKGVVTPVAAGTANITATATLGNVSVSSPTATVVTVKAATAAKKAATIKASKTTLKAKTLKKKAQKVTIKVTGSKGKVTVKNATSKKLKKYVKISGKKVTIKKGAKKGTYKVKVTVAAKGNYKKTVKTIKISVK